MFRLIRPRDFLTAVSRSPRLKFILAWITFGGLVVPSAFLMSFGFSEKYVLPGMLAVIPLFQYLILCMFPALNRVERIQDNKINVHVLPVLHHAVNSFALMYPTVEEKPGGYYVIQARKGVGKTSVYADALLQTLGASVPHLSETYHKSMVVLAEGQTDLNFIAFLTSTEAEKKTRDEMIKLQRKSLVASDETALPPRMMLSHMPQHG